MSPLTLSAEDIQAIAQAVVASGAVVSPPPPPQEVHPAEPEKTPVDRLLEQLRIDPGPNSIATVETWLVDEGYEEKPATEETEDAAQAPEGEQGVDPGAVPLA